MIQAVKPFKDKEATGVELVLGHKVSDFRAQILLPGGSTCWGCVQLVSCISPVSGLGPVAACSAVQPGRCSTLARSSALGPALFDGTGTAEWVLDDMLTPSWHEALHPAKL
jgi:hypothetical protein